MASFPASLRSRSVLLGAIVLIAAIVIGLLATSGMKRAFDVTQKQRVSASSELRLQFPDLLDHASVTEHLSLPGDLEADARWEGETLVLKPKQNLISGRTYVVSLDRRTKKADGTLLGRDLDFTFIVSGAPAVVAHMPAADAKSMPTESEVTLIFDRPVVPLTQVQGDASAAQWKDWPVTIEPKVDGRWRWLGTTTARFIPGSPLTLATLYTVTVPSGIETVSGDKTEKDFSWSFETQRPEVTGTDPGQYDQYSGPTTLITVHFNQEIDISDAKQKFVLWREQTNPEKRLDERKGGSEATPADGRAPLGIKSLQYGTKIVKEKKVTDKTAIIVTPAQPLGFSSSYGLTVQAGLMGLEGHLGTAQDYVLSFGTVGLFRVQQSYYRDGQIRVDFTNPIAGKTLAKNFTISPQPKDWKDAFVNPDWDWDGSTEISLYPSLAPSTTYTVTVKTGLRDKYGQPLAEEHSFSFKTPPLTPRLMLHHLKGSFGIFERDKAPVYYVNAVNVSKVTADFGKLTLQKFLESRQKRRGDYNYRLPVLTETQEARQFTLKPVGKQDTWEILPLDVQKLSGKTLASGIYAVAIKAPEYRNPYANVEGVEEQIFVLTNMAITLKYSGGKALIWVTDVKTGDPVQEARIQLFNLDAKAVLAGMTDKSGFFETVIDLAKFETRNNSWQPEFWVTAEKDGDFAFVGSEWTSGIQPYDFDNIYSDFRSAGSSKYRLQSFVYTDRPLLTAGDTVHFKGIIRLLDWNGVFTVPPVGNTVNVSIRDPKSDEIYNKSLAIDEFGGFSGEVPIAKEAALGEYWLTGSMEGGIDVTGNFGTNFSVLAYRKPEYRVEVKPETENSFTGDRLKAVIEGAYYFGAPMGGAKVTWTAMSTDFFFNRYTGGWYSFALEDSWCWWECSRETKTITSGEGVLDSSGNLAVSFPVTLDDKGVSQVVSIEANVTDPNNQLVSNRSSVIVHKADVYVGIRNQDYVVTPGQQAKLDVVAVDLDGRPKPGQSVTVQLFSREWNTIKEKGVDGEYYYSNEPKDTFVRQVQVATDDEGKAVAAILVDTGGEFRAVATVRDSKGREAKAGAGLYAWSSTYVNWPHMNNDKISVVTDKPEYKPGETAKLLVKSPYQGKGVKALVTLERENVLKKWIVDVTSNALPIEVPITEDLVPTAYVSVVVIKPRMGETFDAEGKDTGLPAFKIGYAKLKVDISSKKLTVAIQPDKRTYGPGETVTVKLKAWDATGKPVKTGLSLAAVDLSLLALTGFKTPDIVGTFYSERGLGVSTAQMLMYLVERFKPGSKGGGGGADGEEGNTGRRGDFRDVAYWNAKIVTDDNGEATVSFKLPDNLTTWNLLAIGSTKQHLFGAEATTIIETKKVIVRPVRPRFAVRGDQIELGAIVHNFLDAPETFTVTLKGTGFIARESMTKSVTLKPGEQQKLMFPVTIDRTDKATFVFSAVSPRGNDEIEESIPVYPFGTPQTVATMGVTEDVVTEQVLVPTKQDAEDGTLTVAVSPTLATYLPGGLEYVATFPYGCAEQTMSSLLPNVALKTLQGFEAFRIVDDATLETNVTEGLQKLYAFQRNDGGFGYWEGSPYSYPYLTAYILYALQITEKAGYSVDASVMESARAYLDAALRNQTKESVPDAATRAYILFVLSEQGRGDLSLMNNLYEERSDLPVFSRAHLAMALEKTGVAAAKKKADTLLTEILNGVRIDPRGAHFEEGESGRWSQLMHTNTRTTAFVLQALLRTNPEHPLIPRIVRYLLEVRRDGHWDTTQSTAVTILALVDFLRSTGELNGNFSADVNVAGKDVLEAAFDAKNILSSKEAQIAFTQLSRGKVSDIAIGKQGLGKLYYDILLSYFYTPETIPPADQGISILREMTPLDPKQKQVKVGTTHKITLTISVPETRHFVAVESPLPAGMEAIDFHFQTVSRDALEGSVNEDKRDSEYGYYYSDQWRFSHIEFRDDRVFLFADELAPGVYEYEYLVRATTPGRFEYRPARVWEMYFPENFGQTSGEWFSVAQ